MRFLSILTAIVVGIALYAIVFERDRVLAIAGKPPEDAQAAGMPEATPEAPTSIAGDMTQAELVSVVVLDSVADLVETSVVLRGQTQADREIEVKSQISGLVISPPLQKGTFVEAGTVLCEIDPGTRPAQLAEAEARLAEAQISNTAASKLAEGGFASETRAVGAKATLQSAQAAVEAANTEIDRLKITAPFAGLLESDTAELGSLMQAGAHCATVIQLNPIKIVAYLPETMVDAVKLDAMAQARLSTGREVTGRVTFIARSADPQTRTFRVEVSVENDDLSIRDGLTANIAIAADGVKAHLIPASALTLNDHGTMGVRVVGDDDVVQFYPVRIERDTLEGVIITGVPDTAAIITVGQEYVTEGVRVKIGKRGSNA
ncbi:efflux RND transporter periplasmic adaptor subunit [Meridianimarinicoccus sp. MJW13]|uniref:efflux RND transporter periplasmic adaptor subunit n=1 Tax=Meridianimarinicoccus sp. MJW13 TaxID=2720031 RepID=UPI001866703F|nr:efflux RND transporter periplasmic adaptor subunit [Fluviibacterium sp. MJW13]